MKHITLFLILLLSINCNSQNQIVGFNKSYPTPTNAYKKDLNNDLDKFTGTWKYSNGSTELTVVIIKKEQVYNGSFYSDELAGNYRYLENGVEIVNTLTNDINEETSFSGIELFGGGNEFSLSLRDPGKPRASYRLRVKYLGISILTMDTKMEWKLMQNGFYSGYVPGETRPTEAELDQTMRLPREVTLIKQ